MSQIDLILGKIVGGALETAAEEMSATVTRTARSPLFNEAHDFTTGIFDYQSGDARLISQAPGCTLHLYAICPAVKAALQAFKYDLHPGDVILASDPYDGGTHIPDHVLIMPIFVNRKPMFFPVVRAHFADVGGPVSGGYNPRARDIWQDGVIVPPMKLYERGEKRRDAFDLIVSNNRVAHWLTGDLEAMRGACQIAGKRIEKLIDRFGSEKVLAAIDANIEYSEQRVRAEIQSWKDGKYYAETFIDHDYQGSHDIKVSCLVTVDGSNLTFDYSGSSPEVAGFVNSPEANTASFIFVAIASCCDEDIPINEGYINPVKMIIPEGTVVNPNRPKPVGNCTCICGAEVAEAALLALAQCAPERVGVNCHKLPLAYTSGKYENGESWVNLNFFGYTGGAGAAFGTDGWGLYPPLMTGVILPSIEMTELQYPVRIRKHEYIQDATGAGRWRGAPGLETHMEYLTDTRTNIMLAGVKNPTRGFCGGEDGAPNRLSLRSTDGAIDHVEEVAYNYAMEPGGVIEFIRGGGGGWGDPTERPSASVAEDVKNQYLSISMAFADYGVVVNDQCWKVDEEATKSERALRQSQR